MSSILQCLIGGASGASGGSPGLLNPKGMTSDLLLCARACCTTDKSSKCPVTTGCEAGLVAWPTMYPISAALIATRANILFMRQTSDDGSLETSGPLSVFTSDVDCHFLSPFVASNRISFKNSVFCWSSVLPAGNLLTLNT